MREQRTWRGSARRAVNLLAAGLAALAATWSAGHTAERIVSMNVCTDQLVMLLADRDRIASVSYLAAEPTTSAMADLAAGLTLNHGLAEEILPMNPDLVLAGALTTRPTVFLLRRFGFRVVEIPVAASLDDVRKNIRAVAEAIGRPDRGERLVAEYDERLASLSPAAPIHRPLAALYWANGYTSGGGTLANAVVEAAGFRTLAGELGMVGTRQLPLEVLLAADPDVLITGRLRDDPALANEAPRHPALRLVYENGAVVSVPDNLWVCGTPFVLKSVERLSSARLRLNLSPRRREHR